MQTVGQTATDAAKERIDDLQRAGCRIIQNPELFCFGMDAVLLAAFAQPHIHAGMKVLDLCSGNGVIPILLDARLDKAPVSYTGVEINPVCVDMARRSALMNGQQERIRFIEEDIRNICAQPAQEGLEAPGGAGAGKGQACGRIAPASFDAVTVNPPYMSGGGGLKTDSYDRTIARHEVLCGIGDVAKAACFALRPGGHLYMVHRPHRLGDIFSALSSYSLEVKRMRMVYPYQDREANMVLLDAVRGGKSYIHVEEPLIIYQEKGVYTQEVRDLYG